MLKPSLTLLFLLSLVFTLKPSLTHANTTQALKESKPCDDLIILSSEDLNFNSNELVFLCGKSRIKEWNKIPDYQTRFHLKAMLQARGYHLLDYFIKKNILYVKTGPKTFIKSISYISKDGPIGDWTKTYHGPIGEPLTPENLESIKSFVRLQLAKNGNPCAQVEALAFAQEGSVEVTVKIESKSTLTKVHETYDERFNSSLFRRFYAFEVGKPFNTQLLDLSARRIMDSGIAQFSQFSPRCPAPNGIEVDQRVLLGKPILLSLGVGGSTEDGPLAQLTWKNARMGKNGSQSKLSLYTSFRQQRIQLIGKLFVLDDAPRFYIEPSLTFRRITEPQLKTLEGEALVFFAKTWDNQNSQYELKVGPSYNYYDSIEAAFNTTQYYPSLRAQWSRVTHDFEYNLSNPIEGTRLLISTELVDDGLGSGFSAYQFRVSGHYLNNLGDYSPAHLVLGLRFGFLTTSGTSQNDSDQELPLKFRYFIGGAQNLRGFDRNELPRGGKGAFSAFYSSLELRNFSLIGPAWQPLVFADIGLLGESSSSLQTPIYWSPGFGMRWDSPVGVFRSTLAHGYIWQGPQEPQELSHLQFFLSYGKEF